MKRKNPRVFVHPLVLSSIVTSFAVMARVLKTPTTTFITTSLIPLIPGGSLYYTMAYAFESNSEMFASKALYTLELASALALGIIVAATATKIYFKVKSKFIRK